jgi:DegV family protein with EDD domain
MKVKIVTDSTSDISREVAQDLGIIVIPGYVRFGRETYRDGVDLSKPGFYQQLIESPFHPVTSEATPKDFAEVYSRCADEAGGIISIHISSKLSRTYASAQKGKKMIKGTCEIEVIDSHFASIGLGLIVIAAARLANIGESMQSIVEQTKKAVSRVSILGFFDTMKYIAKGRRATKGVIELSGLFQIKPILTFKDGEVVLDGLVRTYSQGIERLYKFASSAPAIQNLGIAYSTDYDRAEELRGRLGSVFPEQEIYVEQIGAALGAHCGPDALVMALRRAE